MEKPLEIVCGVDSAYAPHLGVLLRSISSSNTSSLIRVHVLHDGVNDHLQKKVESCAPHLTIEWHGIVDHQALGFQPLLQISRATYLRLIIDDVLSPLIKRVLYLDVDMIVNGDLTPLWSTDLKGNPCAAVVDPGIPADAFAAKHALSPSAPYFNAGVLLLDLELIRNEGLLKKAIKILADPNQECEYADQDALNIVFWDRWVALDPAWNFQRKFLYDGFASWYALSPKRQSAPLIVHYTEQYKPWKKSEWHPYAWLYLKNLLQTPFNREIMHSGGLGVFDQWKWWLRWRLKRPAIFVQNSIKDI